MSTGAFEVSRSHLEEGLALYNPTRHSSIVDHAAHRPDVHAQAELGIVLFCLGYPAKALARSSLAIGEAQKMAHTPTLALSLALSTVLLSLVGDDVRLTERTDQLIAMATQQGFPRWRAMGTINRGWLKVKKGNVAEGISLLRSGSAAYRATGAQTWMPHYIGLTAAASEIAGQIEEAVTLMDDALQVVEKTGERWFAAELIRHKGQLLLRQGHREAAEEIYCNALSIAQRQKAKLWELRAAVSLARLRCDQGRRAEARDVLAPIYGWFTEGFDTPDLKHAETMLEELK
jgi:predicted ATPase